MRTSFSRNAALAFSLLGAAALLGAAGCTTEAFCFDHCAGDSADGSGGKGASGSGNGGDGGILFTGSGGGSDCSPNCGPGSGSGGCSPTNGGIEICDGIDNDCDGTIDNGSDIDLESPKSCGTCANNCYVKAINCDPLTIECVSPDPGKTPGTCKCGACAQDYFDLEPKNGSCEYYCVKTANDDAVCNNKDDDCDGEKDEDVDLCKSPDNCGKCGGKCVVVHGTPECEHTGTSTTCDTSNTQCKIKSCTCTGPGNCFFDLDKSYATGCEYQCDLTNGGVEICGDGLDNDCDGKLDEADDLSQDTNIGAPCSGDPDGECATAAHAGTKQCIGHKVVCVGPNVIHQDEKPELCNGKDDDCDGVIDDNATDAGGACGTSNVFPCAFGTKQCKNGVLDCVGDVNPGVETCNGKDDDCDGTIDKTGTTPPSDSVGTCNVPAPPPAGATSPCKAGTKTCTGGTVQCTGSVLPTSTSDTCGVDANCDGVLTNQPDLKTDVHNCGACGNDCLSPTNAVHANWTCVNSACVFLSCQSGYVDLNNDKKCETPCTFISAQEACNGVDDNCNGQTDENVVAPSPSQVCGVSPSASKAECTTGVTVACQSGGWKCTFPAGVCSPTCAGATEICDTLDNNCNGLVNENVANFGTPCASDDGLPPPGDGACRTTGTFVCNGTGATKCSAVKNVAAAGPELCDTIDNDCDGLVDEPFNNKGSNATHYVKPAVTKLTSSLWVMSYEASRPTATTITPGTGNGYYCKAISSADPKCNDSAIPLAPAGVTLDKTPACSVQGKIPWFNATPVEAEQTCKAMGGKLCSTGEWQVGCAATASCKWGYNPRGTACTTTFTASKLCNLGLSFDFDPNAAGDQDGLLVTGSPKLANCWADWLNLQGNTAANDQVFDITGNLREITKSGANTYPLMGGSFKTVDDNGATCGFSFYTVDQNFQLFDLGFRCCFATDPTL
jgi:hypothetical protein